jgi:hypothetical protein
LRPTDCPVYLTAQLLLPVENRGQDFLKTARLQQAALNVIGDEHVELFHRDSTPLQPVSPWRALVEQV